MFKLINQSILKIFLIIDYKSVISIMLIIPKDILFTFNLEVFEKSVCIVGDEMK